VSMMRTNTHALFTRKTAGIMQLPPTVFMFDWTLENKDMDSTLCR